METTWVCCMVVILDGLVYELFHFFSFPSIHHSHDNITLTDVSHTKIFHFAAQYHLTSIRLDLVSGSALGFSSLSRFAL